MDTRVVVLIALSAVSCLGAARFLYRSGSLPNMLYGVCVRIACALIPLYLALTIAATVIEEYDLVAALSQLVSVALTGTFFIAELEMLHLLLPEYGIASATIVVRLQIASAVVALLVTIPIFVVAANRKLNKLKIASGAIVAWMAIVAIYDVAQQILMLHNVLSKLKNPPAWFRPRFVVMTSACIICIIAGIAIEMLLSNIHIMWSSIASTTVCGFTLLSAEAMSLLRELIKSPTVGVRKPKSEQLSSISESQPSVKTSKAMHSITSTAQDERTREI
ncbi:hypothetical protein HK105_200435 [Polyrhizophydium stewartii]|uniref:Transmembrane protein n=1 Tax=Polyrhizophydium stewartii TaxID=2732419 RepID=A0ABR4NLE7_9FUNG